MDDNRRDLIICATVKLDAYKFVGNNQDDIENWSGGKVAATISGNLRISKQIHGEYYVVSPGTWIIKDSAGNFFPLPENFVM